MQIVNYVEDKNTSEFYPTPENLIQMMYSKVNWNYVNTVLEPSVGKGDIIRYLNRRTDGKLDIDCIELDNNLRQIFLYTFSEENSNRLLDEKKKITKQYSDFDSWSENYKYYNQELRQYVPVPEPDNSRLRAIDTERKEVKGENVHLVHDDFLTFTAYKQYNVIIMNPPFSNGDKHLLKALEIQKYGGQIVCLLNAETIRNPYTETRKELIKILNDYNANIEYYSGEFNNAERQTDVEVAMIYVNIPMSVNDNDDSIFDKLKKEEHYEEPTAEEVTALDVTDYLKSVVNKYNIEIKSGIELINSFERMKPYLSSSFDTEDRYPTPIIQLTDGYGKDKMTINKYVKAVRYKYWRALFSNPKFTGNLTSKLQEQYRAKVETFSQYDFSEFNIKNLLVEMKSKVKTGIEDEIEKMFDKMTVDYACSDNSKYLYNAWKTNIGHKIGKKVIMPFYGLYDSIFGHLDLYKLNERLSDIERILNYFDGNMTADVDIYNTVKEYADKGITKNIPLKYFTINLYLKGSVHITFNCPELIQKYNIYVGKNRGWLPFDFGTKTYKQMDEEEKKVVDSFSGEREYDKIIGNRKYYLGGINNTQALLSINA